MTVTGIHLADGTEISAADAVCEGCGESMNSHSCGAAAAPTVVVSRSGKGTTRKPIADKPVCPHCDGVMHHNMSASAVNSECLNRQYSMDKGDITDPNQRPPVLTVERMGEIFDWSQKLATPVTYGGMVHSAGGAGTYSASRPKTGRKKKAVAAAPGSQIQDMADEEAAAVAAEAKPKSKRKAKGLKVTRVQAHEDGSVTSESVDAVIVHGIAVPVDELPQEEAAVAEAEEIIATPIPARLQEMAQAGDDESPVPTTDEDAARAARAEKRRLRKQRAEKLAKAGSR